MKILGIVASSLVKAITDLFTRTTAGSLGTANSGQSWVSTRGVWYANGSAAQSDDAASTYPISTIHLSKTDVTVSATISEGCGVVIWESSANSWYSVSSINAQSSYSCNCQTCYNSCANCAEPPVGCGSTTNNCVYNGASTIVSRRCSASDVSAGKPGCSSTGNCVSASVGSGVACGWSCPAGSSDGGATGCGSTASCYRSVTTCNSCVNSSCSTYSCNCQTCTSTSYAMRLLRSVSGTISQVVSDVALSANAAALRVVASGTSITATAYSDTGFSTAVGTTTVTPSPTPVTGTGVGIIKSPAGISQGSTVDNFSAV
jgi:hypothetical protein